MIRRLLMAPILRRIALDRPARRVDSGGREYLYRIFLAERNGRRYYLHWFAGIDGDRHTHSHPFNGLSIVLCGGYREELLDQSRHRLLHATGQDTGFAYTIKTRRLWNRIRTTTFHRIADALKDTWTLFVADQHCCPWYFAEEDFGGRLVFHGGESGGARWWEKAPTLRQLLEAK